MIFIDSDTLVIVVDGCQKAFDFDFDFDMDMVSCIRNKRAGCALDTNDTGRG